MIQLGGEMPLWRTFHVFQLKLLLLKIRCHMMKHNPSIISSVYVRLILQQREVLCVQTKVYVMVSKVNVKQYKLYKGVQTS